MRRRAVLLLAGVIGTLAFAPTGQAADPLTVSVDRDRITAALGQKATVRSTITNHGSTAAHGVIAHLNVLSLRDGVYVDPEDWSSNRTQYLGTIAPGASRTLRWQIKAVNAGRLAVYVSVLRERGAGRPPVNGPAVHLAVSQRRTLNTGGVLPLALGVPALLGSLSLAVMFRRRG